MKYVIVVYPQYCTILQTRVISMITKITGMRFDEIDWGDHYIGGVYGTYAHTHTHTTMIIFCDILYKYFWTTFSRYIYVYRMYSSRLYLRVVSFTIEEYFSARAITLIAPVILVNSRFDVTYERTVLLPMQTQMIGKTYLASVYIENEIYRNCARVCSENSSLIRKSFSHLRSR